MARGGLEFCPLGHRLFPLSLAGKEDLREVAGAEQGVWTCLHTFADPCHMGDLWNFRYQPARRISRKYGRHSQRGDSGGEDATGPLLKGICATFDSVCYFCNAPAGEILLEVEGSLVHHIDLIGGVLVVGI